MRFSPPPVKKPVILTDELVEALLDRAEPIILKDGPVPVAGIYTRGKQRLDAGTIARIYVNPLTNSRHLYGIDFQTGKVRCFGPPRPPKSR